MASRATLGLLRRPNTTYVLISQRRACAALSLSSRHTLSLHTLCTRFIRQQANTSRKPCERFTRSFTTSQTENGVAETFPDPDRPDLFYHLFTPPTPLSSTHPVYALSFLSSPPSSIMSASVIGWLPASGEGEGAGLNDFVENGTSSDIPPLHACRRVRAAVFSRTYRGFPRSSSPGDSICVARRGGRGTKERRGTDPRGVDAYTWCVASMSQGRCSLNTKPTYKTIATCLLWDV